MHATKFRLFLYSLAKKQGLEKFDKESTRALRSARVHAYAAIDSCASKLWCRIDSGEVQTV